MNEHCLQTRGEATELLMLGRPLTAELSLHVASCSACARDIAEVREVVATFAYAEGNRPPAVSPELGPRIEAELRAATGARRVRRLVLAAAAFVLVMAVAVGSLVMVSGSSPVQQIALERDGLMVSQPWGTEVPIMLNGLRHGETYQLVTVGLEGRSVPAGSVRAEGPGPFRARMVTAMSRDSITALLVRDDDGRQVAQLPVAPRG
ncbi:hypothetical protein DL990_21835 [Amycolatopsis sp. WAC 01416]|uniref:hypothetical protein n=1 Tax=Amycolatopsis sp. WAC 01416 TaxID=2203196 RepID=UPI000F7B6002|nr:hypothetical protein [Amycolatopsis sp. WAC 01416]RSN30621.1 hypothetical protein DL990_21835 [Amycolatopsis sp. WAC 01416]